MTTTPENAKYYALLTSLVAIFVTGIIYFDQDYLFGINRHIVVPNKSTSSKKQEPFDFYDNQLEHLYKRPQNKSFFFKDCPKAEKNSTPRVLCTVFTSPKNFRTKALAVNLTWGSACDTLLFVTSDQYAKDRNIPDLRYAFLPNYKEDYSKLTIKTIKTIIYVYLNYQNKYDWMLKADDDTFIIMKNLKAFLKDRCVYEPHVYGYSIDNGALNSGGAGYLLNSQTINAFIERYYTDKDFCKHRFIGWEDLDIHRCLAKIGVRTGETRDGKRLQRFHSHSYEASKREANAIRQNLSQHSISFHWMKPEEIIELHKSNETFMH